MRNKKQDLLKFILENGRKPDPTKKEENSLYMMMYRYVQKGDDEVKEALIGLPEVKVMKKSSKENIMKKKVSELTTQELCTFLRTIKNRTVEEILRD